MAGAGTPRERPGGKAVLKKIYEMILLIFTKSHIYFSLG